MKPMNAKNGRATLAVGEAPGTKLNAAEMNRRATEYLRAKGLIRPFRRTAVRGLKEFAP